MSQLTFRESDHSYFLGTRQIPGITRILADLGCYPGSNYFTENSRVRGQQVHLACQFADQHALDAESLDAVLDIVEIAEPLHPFLAGYLKFRREKRYRAEKCEQIVCSRKLRAACRYDSFGCCWDNAHRGPVMVEIKTWTNQGQKPKHSSEIQTAFQVIAALEHHELTHIHSPAQVQRWTVTLPGDGDYRCFACDDTDNFWEAQDAVKLWHKWHDRGIFKFAGEPELGEN